MAKLIVAVLAFIAAFAAHGQSLSEDSLRLAHSLIEAARSQSFNVGDKALPSVCFPPSPLPAFPDAYSTFSGYTGQWGSRDWFSARFWRQPCSPGDSQTYLYLRITPTVGVPFICGSSMAIVQGGYQYDVKLMQTYNGNSFCDDLYVPTTFLVGQWSFGPFYDKNGALTLYHQGVYATYQASLPAYTSGVESSSVVEYYHAGLDHYFMTADPAEIAALDGGAYGGVWKRTFYEFESFLTPAIASVPVCRFFSAAFVRIPTERDRGFRRMMTAESDDVDR